MKKARTIRASRTSEFGDNLEFLLRKYHSLEITSTAYSYKVEVPSGMKYTFTDNKSGAFFRALSMVQKDAREINPEQYQQYTPERVTYYNTQNLHNVTEKMFLVDITAAYPTTAYKKKIIREETFKAIMKLPKKERLQTLGVLARKTITTKYEAGEVTSVKITPSPTAGLFFEICEEVGRHLQHVFMKYPSSALFWVDGIFFNSENDASASREYFEQNGYSVKMEIRTGCKVTRTGKAFLYYEGEKRKCLFLPQRKKTSDTRILNFLQTPKNTAHDCFTH